MIEYNKKYKYKQLCDAMEKEYKKGGKYQTILYNELSRDYEIEKDGLYYIISRELSDIEKLERIKYNKSKEYIEPILYNILLNAEDNNILLSMSELFTSLYMVNGNYLSTKYKLQSGEIEKINDYIVDGYEQLNHLNNFIYESSDIIRRIIKDILNDMVDKKLIIYNEILYYVKTINDNGFERMNSYQCEDIPNHLQTEKEVMLSYGYERDSQIRWNDRKYIRKDVSIKLGIDYYYNKYNITINKIGIRYQLEKIEYARFSNDYIYHKLMNSKQGTLKDIDKEYKSRLINTMIKINI